jgi:ribosomal protein S18 acetylase RimI-like enzyme
MSSDTAIVAMQRLLVGPRPLPHWPPGISTSPLRASDARPIHALIQRAYANGYGTVQPDWLDWWEWLTTDAEFDQKLCLVARAGDGIAGFCLVWTSAFVKDLVVDPGRHGSGIGTALLATAIAEMQQRGHAHLRLKVDARNLGARRFYERMGFSAESLRP